MSAQEDSVLRCLAAILRVREWRLRPASDDAATPSPADIDQELEAWLFRLLDAFVNESGLLRARRFDPQGKRSPQLRGPEIRPVLLPLVALADEVALGHRGKAWGTRVQQEFLDIADAGDEVFEAFSELRTAVNKRQPLSKAGELARFTTALVLLLGYKGQAHSLSDANMQQKWLDPAREVMRERGIEASMVDVGQVVPKSVRMPAVLTRGPIWMGPTLIGLVAILVVGMGLYLSALRSDAERSLSGFAHPTEPTAASGGLR